MKPMPPHDTDLHRDDTAIDWLMRLREQPRNDALLAAWLDWCVADAANAEAFRRMCDLWNAFDEPELRALLSRLPVATPAPQRRAARTPAWALAASLLIALPALWLAYSQWQAPPPLLHQTRIAEVDTRHMTDGSRVDVGAGSRIISEYREKRRQVTVEHGEAYFEVAPDPQRPFVVRAGGITVRALGTAFNVRTGASRTVITVTEGRVEVLARNWLGLDRPPAGQPVLLGPGQQAIHDMIRDDIRVVRAEPEAVTAWRLGEQTFRFVNEPLGDVLAYVNRYSHRRIHVLDPELARRTFTGTVHHDRGEDWLLALERAYPLRVVQLDADTIELRPLP